VRLDAPVQQPMKTTTTKHARQLATSVTARRGFSLLEVLLSLGIFLTAFVALSQLSTNGMNAAIEARLTTNAILRCESKLAEIVAAVEPLEAVADQPFQDDESWTWTLQTAAGPHADLQNVTVIVKHEGANKLASTSYSMSRLIRDPIVYEMAAAAEEEAAALEDEL
jgi:general secretion pathway protein I